MTRYQQGENSSSNRIAHINDGVGGSPTSPLRASNSRSSLKRGISKQNKILKTSVNFSQMSVVQTHRQQYAPLHLFERRRTHLSN